mmetsp:Transcript_92687/g.183973  ORF Transcript_92687/g.183973 Transcript_92687/m.183973 type:complete len:409 (-) Transcript_92687:168-1394(-)
MTIHNLHEQLSWLGSCQSWEQAFGARLNPELLGKRAALEPPSTLTVDGDWKPLWNRAWNGTLHGGEVIVDKRRGGRNRPQGAANVQRNANAQAALAHAPHHDQFAGIEGLSGVGVRHHHASDAAVTSSAGTTWQQVTPSNDANFEDSASLAPPNWVGAPAQVPQNGAQWIPQNPSEASGVRPPKRQAPEAQPVDLECLSFDPGVRGMGALAGELQKWRLARAASRKKKAFQIFNNKVLDAIATAAPTTEQALCAVPGFSEAKAKEFGSAILKICRNHATSMPQQVDGPWLSKHRAPATPQAVPHGMPPVIPHSMPHTMPQVQLQSPSNAQLQLSDGVVGAPPRKRARNMPASFAANCSAAPPAVPTPQQQQQQQQQQQHHLAAHLLARCGAALASPLATGRSKNGASQ